MNISTRKSNLTNLLNNLSETSNDFLTEINQNLNLNSNQHKFLLGGSCPCTDVFKAFKSNNIELALYILEDKKCCFSCKDDNGNTLLHHLVYCCTKHNNNDKCFNLLKKALKHPNVSEFINLQNSNGTTPILLAVEQGNEAVANKLDEAGANKTIPDNSGNYLQTLGSEQTENSSVQSDVKSVSVSVAETPNEQVCINNVVKLVINDKSKDDNQLTSLDLSSLADSNNTISLPDDNISSLTSNSLSTEQVKDKLMKDMVSFIDGIRVAFTDKYLEYSGCQYEERMAYKAEKLLKKYNELKT